jgi:TetR/AcrR family transcriptional repressor of nem operon
MLAAATELMWQQSMGTVSVEAICDKAEVKKGSFYHFFPSKEALVLSVLDAHWGARKPSLDALFSPTVPPLERLRRYFHSVYERQLDAKKRYGRYLGCFYTAVGMDCQSPLVEARVQEILIHYTRYYESALHDAASHSDMPVAQLRKLVREKAASLFAYMEGALAQARMRDDASLIRDLERNAFAFLGIELQRGVAAEL